MNVLEMRVSYLLSSRMQVGCSEVVFDERGVPLLVITAPESKAAESSGGSFNDTVHGLLQSFCFVSS